MYKYHITIFIAGLLMVSILAALNINNAVSILTMVTLFTYITQMGLLVFFSGVKPVYYSDRVLFGTTLIYTVLIGYFFMLISLYYDDDTFMFSRIDAMFYYRESIKCQQIGFWDNALRIIRTIRDDDWGNLLFNNLFFSIIPDKLFVNAVYFTTGALSTVFLFRMGKEFLTEQYAFLSALAYGTSSYVIWYHCSFLKESLFVFFVVSAFYYQYCAIKKQSLLPLLGSCLFVFFAYFFRPAVAAFIVMSMFLYYAIVNRGNAISFFLFLIIIVMSVLSFTVMQENVDRYTSGGDIDNVINGTNNSSYSHGFNYFVSFFGAFFGPFPSLFFAQDNPDNIGFYWPGILYRLFMVFPFWWGVFMVWKRKEMMMIPMLSFVLIEMFSTGAVCASLELRKVILHFPFMAIIAFYGLSNGYFSERFSRLRPFVSYAFVFGVLFLWTIIRDKG